ncbi:hypothetical protein [Actinoalloteichus hymeniacidonis]|uniref:hypothetical protein n=1 Tax=Actinoalloteichus hymeniacidonis TaxID=340345 RepID=UPI0012F79147|nr:hypothetical protein [Actinoalloteichus hymeniacidonis]MBB5907777.1 hypothetical protein [Actinoalloteichus hymeniacidonis]
MRSLEVGGAPPALAGHRGGSTRNRGSVSAGASSVSSDFTAAANTAAGPAGNCGSVSAASARWCWAWVVNARRTMPAAAVVPVPAEASRRIARRGNRCMASNNAVAT